VPSFRADTRRSTHGTGLLLKVFCFLCNKLHISKSERVGSRHGPQVVGVRYGPGHKSGIEVAPELVLLSQPNQKALFWP
jgi:hypothetical protein